MTPRATLLVLLAFNAPVVAADPVAIANRVDRHLAAAQKAADVEPLTLANDAEFLRRVTLDLVGRVPTPEEIRSFLADTSEKKRSKVIDRLLASPAYPRHWANVWRRHFIPQADTQQFAGLVPDFEAWLQGELAANTAYDKLSRSLLTSPLVRPERTAPAVGFILAGENKPENLAANTARVFLGINLDCAQCHDHPFAKWTRQQFWDFAAFFTQPTAAGGGKPARLELVVPEIKLTATPNALGGDRLSWPDTLAHDTGRKVLADWVTARGNPYFARNAVNRVWADLFGRGLVEPLDDLSESNPASHPKLLDELANSFAESGYDLKFLIRSLTNTAAYQRASLWPKGKKPADPKLFAAMPVRGLSGEQLYDSLCVASGLPLDSLGSQTTTSPRRLFAQRFLADRPATGQRSVLQGLELMNGPLVRGLSRDSKTLAAVADAPFLDANGQVEALFLAALGRRPSLEEAAELREFVEADGGKHRRERLADVFWALLNSVEFSVNH